MSFLFSVLIGKFFQSKTGSKTHLVLKGKDHDKTLCGIKITKEGLKGSAYRLSRSSFSDSPTCKNCRKSLKKILSDYTKSK